MDQDLTRAETHFAFGRNWAEYATKITEAEVREAEAGLSRLLGGERLDGKRFLDIGSGSGVHSLAALRLGAREVVAVDIDADSVATTRAVLSRFASDGVYRIERKSVFDLDPTEWGTFDVVYSWGVLHHTGDLDRALACAARMVAPEGLIVVALYRRIWMDPFWRWEKRWYAQASRAAQARARWVYVTLFRLGLRLTGRGLRTVWRPIAASAEWITTTTCMTGWVAGRMSPSARPKCPPGWQGSTLRRFVSSPARERG